MYVPSVPARGGDRIYAAYLSYLERFRAVTARSRERFERRDWLGFQSDAAERLTLYRSCIDQIEKRIRDLLGPFSHDRRVWAQMKDAYARLISSHPDYEIAETFFNSVTRRLFSHEGVDPTIEYVAVDLPPPENALDPSLTDSYGPCDLDGALIAEVVRAAGLRAPFRSLEVDAGLAGKRLCAAAKAQLGGSRVDALDVLRPMFFRNKGAYIVGRVRRAGRAMPMVLALVHPPRGITLDAALSGEDDASVVFSFTRSYFHVDVQSPRKVIGFLRSIIPRKRVAELYISLGYNKHGKTEFYRDMIAHITDSDERFVVARGKRGMVMAVFTLASYDIVFKLIKDRFSPSKRTTREKVIEKYRLVYFRDRVGRLVDAQEFEHLSFPVARFDEDLLSELLEQASGTVSVQGDHVVIRHLYVERRLTPLNLYILEAPRAAAEAAVLDYGDALKNLAAANIFPGDVLTKNFGVTRHGRVVSYDYDELCLLTDCNFRDLPEPRDDEEMWGSEPWFTVDEGDIFPAELRTFLGLPKHLREVFEREHDDLYQVSFWRQMQERHRSGEIVDFYPYGASKRLRKEA